MLTIKKLTNERCFLCEKTQDTAEVRSKDAKFTGVLCKEHLWAILKKGKSNDNGDSK